MVSDVRKQVFPKGKGNNVHIKITVPSTKNINQKISKAEFRSRVKKVVNFMTKNFKGNTRTSGTGQYKSDDLNRVVEEKVVVVETFTTVKDYGVAFRELKSFLFGLKKVWRQESISFEFEESLYFV